MIKLLAIWILPWRGILSSTEQQRLEQGGYLRQLMATEVTRLMLKALPTLLQKGRTLLPEGQVGLLIHQHKQPDSGI